MRPHADATGKPRAGPIEVKSARQCGTSSLDCFKMRFDKVVGTQYVLHPGQLRNEDERVYLSPYGYGLAPFPPAARRPITLLQRYCHARLVARLAPAIRAPVGRVVIGFYAQSLA